MLEEEGAKFRLQKMYMNRRINRLAANGTKATTLPRARMSSADSFYITGHFLLQDLATAAVIVIRCIGKACMSPGTHPGYSHGR